MASIDEVIARHVDTGHFPPLPKGEEGWCLLYISAYLLGGGAIAAGLAYLLVKVPIIMRIVLVAILWVGIVAFTLGLLLALAGAASLAFYSIRAKKKPPT